MAAQGRLGDKANARADAHGCPGCPHPVNGPGISGSTNVLVNGRPALRVNDNGIHAACCAGNQWQADRGSATVFINGRAAHRKGDATRHCGGPGELVEGSPNVLVGGDIPPAGGASPAGQAAPANGGARGPGAGPGGSTPANSNGGPAGKPGGGAPPPGDLDPAAAEVEITIALHGSDGVAIAADAGGGTSGHVDGERTVRVPEGPCELTFRAIEYPDPIPAAAPLAMLGHRVLRRGDTGPMHQVATDGARFDFQLARETARAAELTCGDGKIVLPAALPAVAACYLALAAHGQSDGWFVTGHGAGSGERALGALLLVGGPGDAWAAHAAEHASAHDTAVWLTWAADQHGWDCAPPESDGESADNLRAALTRFRAAFAELSPRVLPDDTGADGRPGAGTMRGLLELYDLVVGELIGDGDLEPRREQARARLLLQAAPPPPPAPAPERDPDFRYGSDLPPHGGRPEHYPFLRITRDNSLWPSKLSDQATGKAAAYITDLNPLNPHLYKNGSWKAWLVPGDEINLPDSYAAGLKPFIKKEHYQIHLAELPPPPPPPPPAPAGDPNAVDCADHHLATPHLGAPHRSATERAVEVILLPPDAAPPADHVCGGPRAACAVATCRLYDPREYDFVYLDVAKLLDYAGWIELELADPEGKPMAGERYELHGPDGLLGADVVPASGVVRLENVARGPYTIRFPELDARWVKPRAKE